MRRKKKPSLLIASNGNGHSNGNGYHDLLSQMRQRGLSLQHQAACLIDTANRLENALKMMKD